ncbi:hypothetical protein HanRHA438_Chr03g0132511 [Helianthus annuus]|nr:hypothetical protein HanRHA438_Chr03g0132511 [Helianthus annuus]
MAIHSGSPEGCEHSGLVGFRKDSEMCVSDGSIWIKNPKTSSTIRELYGRRGDSGELFGNLLKLQVTVKNRHQSS